MQPFFTPGIKQSLGYSQIRTNEMPWMVTVALSLCVFVIVYEIQTQAVNTRIIALMGMLVAINASLRFLEVAIPGPGGFSPIFFLIIMVGYVFGGHFGFLMGALTLIVSSLITGGVGPWLPGQMFTAGWVGMSTPLMKVFINGLQKIFNKSNGTIEVISLAIFGAFWGLFYGAIMNLWAWPFIAGPSDQYWSPGISANDTLARYATYYMITSFAWDLGRSLGNVIFISIFGAPVLRTLRRFKDRFSFTHLVEELPFNTDQFNLLD
ncbi:MAG: ECF transporter S component [Anaerolineales bacterium]|nr:ECF transporter S component [Anaerolineales bacterium]